jgi:hypothetical protein
LLDVAHSPIHPLMLNPHAACGEELSLCSV